MCHSSKLFLRAGLTFHFVTEDSYEAVGYKPITNEDVCREATIALGAEYPLRGDDRFAGSGAWATDPPGCNQWGSNTWLCTSDSEC